MLARHFFSYLLARGVPGLINFIGIFLFTRLLSPRDYGYYVMVISGVCLVNVVLFQWLRLGLLRFFLFYKEKREVFLSTIFCVYKIIIVLLFFAGLILYFVNPYFVNSRYLILGVLILCIQSVFEAILELNRIKLESKKYGAIITIKATIGLGVGYLLIHIGFGAEGLLIGLLCGYFFPTILQFKDVWRSFKSNVVDSDVLSKVFRYGVPLSLTFLLEFVISSSDRLIIGWMLNPSSAGIYAAGYDLSAQSLGLLMSVVNLAAYPLAVRALEAQVPGGSERQLRTNGTLLFGIGIPVAAIMFVLAANISYVVLGVAFQREGALLMPWITLATLVAGIKAFHFDLSFQLGNKTIGQVWVVTLAATTNLILNILLIPLIGVMGAAYATLVAYIFGLVLSYILGKKIYKIPIPWVELFKILVAMIFMVLIIMPFAQHRGLSALVLQVVAGLLVYMSVICVLNVGGFRQYVVRRLNANS